MSNTENGTRITIVCESGGHVSKRTFETWPPDSQTMVMRVPFSVLLMLL